MNSGKEFEAAIKESFDKAGLFYHKLQDSIKWGRAEGSSFVPSNPFDSIAHASPILFVLEMKSTNGTGISFNPGNPLLKPENEKTNVMIKASQCKGLLKYGEKDGVIAGFILNFRPRMLKTKSEPNETFFVFIEDFMKFATESGKSGINREDCHQIGVPILGEIKKVKYKYDIDSFISDATAKLFQMKPILKETFLKGLENFIKRYK